MIENIEIGKNTSLMSLIAYKMELQSRFDYAWNDVKYGFDTRKKLNEIGKSLNDVASVINIKLAKLAMFGGSEDDMNAAYRYLHYEIDRKQQQLKSLENDLMKRELSQIYYTDGVDNAMDDRVSKKHMKIINQSIVKMRNLLKSIRRR